MTEGRGTIREKTDWSTHEVGTGSCLVLGLKKNKKGSGNAFVSHDGDDVRNYR
jgi:hypothetical protein